MALFLGRRRLATAVTSAGVALLGIATARAEAVGFAWNSDAFSSGTITPDTAYSYSSAGGAISITHGSTGAYTVTFAGLGNGLNSDVQVTGYGSTSSFCQTNGWGSSNGSDVNVSVLCFSPAGAAQDSSFTILYVSRVSGDHRPYESFVWADQPTAADYTPNTSYQYDSSGVPITVSRFSTGSYEALIPGFKNDSPSILVTAYGTQPAHCGVNSTSSNFDRAFVNISCTDVHGVLTDTQFDLTYSNYLMPGYSAGVGASSVTGGAIFAYQPTATSPYPALAKTSIGIDGEPMTSQSVGTGRYDWHMTVEPQWTSSIVLATAYGPPGHYCNVNDWGSSSLATDVYINCYNSKGKAAPAKFLSTFELSQ